MKSVQVIAMMVSVLEAIIVCCYTLRWEKPYLEAWHNNLREKITVFSLDVDDTFQLLKV